MYYMVDENVLENLLKNCSDIYWSEISLEELVAGATDDLRLKRLQEIFKKTSKLKPVVPDPIIFSPEEWGLDPWTNIGEHSKGLMVAVDEVLKARNQFEIKGLVDESIVLCEAKRKVFNDDFNDLALRNKSPHPRKVYEELLLDHNTKKYLARMKRSAYSLKSGLLSEAGFDVAAIRKLGEQVKELSVPDLTESELMEKRVSFRSILKVYSAYAAQRIFQTSLKKYKNDSHDLDIMKYISKGFSIVTAEKRWKKICSFAGLPVEHLFTTAKGHGISLISNDASE